MIRSDGRVKRNAAMRAEPSVESLIRAHYRASAMASACGLKLLEARRSGDAHAAAALKRRLSFWQRRVTRMDAKLRAARVEESC